MNNHLRLVTYTEGEPRRLRRYPHLSEEDVAMLEALPREQARAMENLILAQARSDRRYHQRHLNFTDFDSGGAIDTVSAVADLSRHTTGGGRLLKRLPADP